MWANGFATPPSSPPLHHGASSSQFAERVWMGMAFWHEMHGVSRVRWLPATMQDGAVYRPPMPLSVPHRWTPSPIRPFGAR